jgi:hypothetical protein
MNSAPSQNSDSGGGGGGLELAGVVKGLIVTKNQLAREKRDLRNKIIQMRKIREMREQGEEYFSYENKKKRVIRALWEYFRELNGNQTLITEESQISAIKTPVAANNKQIQIISSKTNSLNAASQNPHFNNQLVVQTEPFMIESHQYLNSESHQEEFIHQSFRYE